MARSLVRATICSVLAMELSGQGPRRTVRWPEQRPARHIPPEGRAAPPGPPASTSSHAISMLGDIGRTTVNGTDVRSGKTFLAGENIYGPFDGGFASAQDHVLQNLGCVPASLGHVDAGIDLSTTEQMIAFQCGVSLPRIDDGTYFSLLDECGGHATEYHLHGSLSCLYDSSSGAHSPQVGQLSNGKFLYGKWEHTANRQLPALDACGCHYGITPESPSQEVYHCHVQDRPPFTVGCYGPNDDGSLVTVTQCRSFYPGCDAEFVNISTSAGIEPYDKWCPCFDDNGVNTGFNFAELSAFTTTTTTTGGMRGWSLLRFVPLKLRSDPRTVQIAEISFRFRGATVSLEHASAFADRGHTPSGYEPAKAIDGLSQTKWVDYSSTPLSIKLSEATPIDSYTLITSDDALDRDPIRWRLEGSNDGGISYDVLHEILQDYETPTDRQLMLEWFRIPRCLEVTMGGGQQACLSVPKLVAQGLAFPATPP